MKMIGISPNRRNFLRKAVTASPAVALLAGVAIDVTSAVATGNQEPYKPSYFTEEEWITLSALVGRLIPADAEGPGAIESGAHEFIDLQEIPPAGDAQRGRDQAGGHRVNLAHGGREGAE